MPLSALEHLPKFARRPLSEFRRHLLFLYLLIASSVLFSCSSCRFKTRLIPAVEAIKQTPNNNIANDSGKTPKSKFPFEI